jgi:general secretion pathway protein D
MTKMNRFYAAVLVAALPWLTGCETFGGVYNVPEPVIAGGDSLAEPVEETALPTDAGSEAEPQPGFERLSPLPVSGRGLVQEDWSDRFPADDEISVAVEDMPLSQFLHYAFGELLGVNYLLSDGLTNLEAPVTLNLQDSVSSRRLYAVTTELLAGRDVGVTFRDEIYYLHPVDRQGKGDVFIGFGASAEDIPDVPGPIMQIIPLRYGLSASLERTLRDLVDAKVVGDVEQGALFVTGERFEIQRVLDVVGLMDRPAQRGRYVGLVSLTYVTIEEFMDRVVELLTAEGVPVQIGSGANRSGVALVSLESLGAVAVFAATRQHLDRVDYWTRLIDRPARGAERSYYIYTPRYARADELGASLVPLLGDPGAGGAAAQSEARDTRSALEGSSARATVDNALRTRRDSGGGGNRRPDGVAVSVRTEDLTMAVDLRANALIFNITGTRYQALLPMIRRLDTPPRQVLLEATIAEVLLTDEFALGVEFALESGDVSLGTTGGLGLPEGGGFISVVGNDGAIRAQLSASNRLVNVLSNPSLVVLDGASASISVGNDIPTVGATFFDPIQSDTQITTVQYRKTGVNLAVRPTINAQGLVVMEIDQDISNTVEGGSDVEGAPAIFERSLSTEVVARSGETVLLGGLIAENNNETVAKVPFLGDIPWLGRLFRSESQTTERTELVVMITPRVLDETARWDSILNRLDIAMRHLSLDGTENVGGKRGENTTK